MPKHRNAQQVVSPVAATTPTASGLQSLRLHNIAIVVSDLDAASDWYERVLGFRREARVDIGDAVLGFMSGGGVTLELIHPSGLDGPQVRIDALFSDPPQHLLAIGSKAVVFVVEDLARASAELEELSVTFVWRERDLAPGLRSTAIRDFDGNLINIFQDPDTAL